MPINQRPPRLIRTRTGVRRASGQFPSKKELNVFRLQEKAAKEQIKTAKIQQKAAEAQFHAFIDFNQMSDLVSSIIPTVTGGNLPDVTALQDIFGTAAVHPLALFMGKGPPEEAEGGGIFGVFDKIGDKVSAIFGKKSPISKGLKGLKSGFGSLVGMAMGFIEKLGVLQPIMDIIGIIFEVIGGAVMEALMPAFQVLIDVITDPVFLDMLMEIGQIIGAILTPIIQIFAEVLQMLMPVILPIVKLFSAFLIPIFEALKPLITALAPLFEGLVPIFEALAPLFELIGGVVGKLLVLIIVILANALIGLINTIAMIVYALTFGSVNLGIIDFIAIPSYDNGGIAMSDQIAKVQKGEKMIPLSQQERDARQQKKMINLLGSIAYTNNQILADKEWRHR